MDQKPKLPDPQHIPPSYVLKSFTPAERMMVTLQSAISAMQSELDDLRAQTALAMNWPKVGAAVQDDVDIVPSSFDIKAYNVDGNAAKVTVRGGRVRYKGISNTPVSDTNIEITGALSSPSFVTLQFDTTTGAITIVLLAADLDDSGSAWFRVLWEMYLTDSGNAAIKCDRRTDWFMGSPIR